MVNLANREEFIYKILHFVGKTGNTSSRISDFSDTTGLRDTNSLVYKLNPLWAQEIGTSLTTLNDEQLNVTNYTNYLAMGYLCNPLNWNNEYVTTQDQSKGIWAIGGTSIEMMFASINARVIKSEYLSLKVDYYSDTDKLGYLLYPNSGYSPNGDGYGYESSVGLNGFPCSGMYDGEGTSYWLVSPAAVDTNSMCGYDSYSNHVKSQAPSNNNYIRVLVSIPSNYRVR